MFSARRHRRIAVLAATLVAALAAGAAPASAGVLVAAATPCPEESLEQPFLPWLDMAQYVLAPVGTFENRVGAWTLPDGAGLRDGNEPFYVHGEDERRSLALPAGSSATSGVMCVGIEHPTLRFFAARTGGSLFGTLDVEVLFEDAMGEVRSVPIGATAGIGGWNATAPMPVTANLLALLPGERTPVAFRFTANGGASWAIDDVYVDPYRRN